MKDLTKKELIKKGIKNTKLKNKLGNVCVYCNCNNKLMLTIDHIKPKIRGGEDTDKNKQITCSVCNFLKGGLNHSEFIKYIKSLSTLKDLNKVKLNIGELNLHFSTFGHPKTLKEVEEKVEEEKE